ncbi:hypothetical protein BD311DRAFT_775768 [Dichomitus squalens]|uniref:Uncharacterized protein n=1 Tax=Dichomitus squalens TaxID=114155 RepID=A0A4Q9MYY1_9APHY|nr:hypothetical protein BD311DRAFT_775768 [Dichomitus squalens]
MTPRSVQVSKSRPLSAIFLGSAGSTPPALPDLPEPPSPSTSSNASGLPSPPATNSTGSGSVGKGSTDAGSLRHRTPSSRPNSSDTSMSGGGVGDRSYDYRKKRSSFIEDEDDADENENDEDHTARFDERRRSLNKGADNASALQRVKSLTQRNRMVLDKLTSISRLNSPVPSNHSRSPRSPPTAGSTSSSSTSATSSRLSSSQNRPSSVTNSSVDGRRGDTQLSGSETERESQRHSTRSTSSDGRTTPPPSAFSIPEIRGASSIRQRRISAPASPGKARAAARDKDRESPGPSRTPRKRVSVAHSVDESYGHYRSDDEDVTAAALAAVASSRRSPTGGKKGRQLLPREFRDRKLSDEKVTSNEPATPRRSSSRAELGRASPSPRKTRISTSDPPGSPRRLGQARYSTVRELTRKHQLRWMSEDLSSPSREQPDQSFDGPGRRQGHRTGSSEGLLGTAGGRSLIGEGLRAAGLTKRRDEDVFTSPNGHVPAPMAAQRTRSSGDSSIISSSEGDSSYGRSLEGDARVEEGVGPPYNPKTPMHASLRVRPLSGTAARPGTSMAALHHDDPAPPRTAPPALRTYKSTYALPDRNLEEFKRQPLDRSSPFGTIRSSTVQSGLREASTDHRRLMLEALTMFESQLSRLPPMGQTSTSTIPEVFQSAQQLVHTLDKLNAMLKEGTNKALEAQIDAELADYKDGVDLPELWREVGSDHRENLRVSDEVVRNMTGFLLGVGKILRETTSSSQHLRTMSLDEEVARRLTPEVQLNGRGRDSDGRRSREARRSWEPGKDTGRLVARLSSSERNGRTGSRPPSSMNMLRSSTATSSSEGRSVAEANDGTPATVRQAAPVSAPTTAARRLYTPRERLDTTTTAFSPGQVDSPADYEPSPTPISRQSHVSFPDRRALPPLAVPPSLPTLPSESLIARSNTASTTAADKLSRRKISASSIVTIRPESSPFTPSIKPPNPTTAVTTATVSTSYDANPPPFPMLRSESGSSSRTNGVTFSRATATSVSSTLSGLQQQHERGARNRKVSYNSMFTNPTPAPVLAPAAPISSSQSGSESERERDRDRDRDSRARTISTRPRASLEGSRADERPVDAVRRSLATTVSYSAQRKERRRTITEIFSQR